MSNALTYTKSLKNPPFLISLLQNTVKTNKLDYYSYAPQTSTLNLTFSQAVDASTKQVIDALIINYNETQASALTIPELSSYRFAQFVMANDAPLSSTSADVIFSTESYVDRGWYNSTPSKSYIYIQKPGTYLIMARVTSYLTEETPTDNVNVIYEFHYDDTRTEQGYLVYPNSSVYTSHTSVTKQETTMLACVFTCNQPQGSFVKVVARVISGTSTISLRGGFTNINIMNIANAAYFESVVTNHLTVPTAFGNVFLGNDRVVNFPFSHTQGQASVTTSAAGWLMLIAKGTFNKTSGTDLTQGNLRFYSVGQFAPFAGTTAYSPIIVPGLKSTSNFFGVVPVNAGTTIAMQVASASGTGLRLEGLESGFIAVFLNATLYPQLSLLNSFTDITQTSGPILNSNIVTDLTFTTLRTLQPPSPNNTIIFSTSSPEIIVNDTGVFAMAAHISLTNQSGNNGIVNVRLAHSVDGGANYYPIVGSNSTRTLPANGKTSVLTTVVIPVSSGHRIKVQAYSNNTLADNVVFSDSCTLSMMKFATATLSTTTSTAFGTQFHVVISKENMSLTTNAYVEKCRLVTQFIPAGIYRISGRASIDNSNGQTVTYRLISSSPTGNVTGVSLITINSTDMSFNTLDYMNLSEGVNTIIMELKNDTQTGYVTVSNALIDIWRVG